MVVTLVCRSADRREGKPPPLLHDVIVHYGERLSADERVNRISRAIRAIHGTKSCETTTSLPLTGDTTVTNNECCSTSPNAQPQPPTPLSVEVTHSDCANEVVEGDEGPVSLILVIGTSLTVLRFYSFLWPRGLRRCLGAGTKSGVSGSCGGGGGGDDADVGGGGSSGRPTKRPRINRSCESTTIAAATATATTASTTTTTTATAASSTATSVTTTQPSTREAELSDCTETCELAIINMQSTCKDGLACFISRRECDDILRETVEGQLGLSV
ncbi:unnamed protein product, partial [Hydatigera taeniaeformis]|uniref:Uncharacterized protein n=1 Tax=Hydatigena taeniaeformis TaxID=6205 RepID=A0A0R3WY91_HYDTA